RNVTGVQTCALPISWWRSRAAWSQCSATDFVAQSAAVPRAVSLRFQQPIDHLDQARLGYRPDDLLGDAAALEQHEIRDGAHVQQIGRASCRERSEDE